MPPISIIIPSHNRRDQLSLTLAALGRQTFPMEALEVIVVADGCTDDTVALVQAYPAAFRLKVHTLPGCGAGAARNAGATLATGGLLIFLDDDIESSPVLVDAHVQAHTSENEQVVIGYLPPVLPHQSGLFGPELRGWWEAMFARLREPGHRFAYDDLLSGNFSIPARTFKRLGGFNPDLRCHEDYEFGYRLIQAGVTFVYAEEALGYHHEKTDLKRSLARKAEEGIADAQLIELHPEILQVLPILRLHRSSLWPSRLLRFLAFTWPPAGEFLAGLAGVTLTLFDRMKLRRPWLRMLDGLMAYRYWTGVKHSIGSLAKLRRRLQAEPAESYAMGTFIELDLKKGIESAEAVLDQARPVGVRLRFGKSFVGWLPPQAGAERLRGAHLRPSLSSGLAAPFLRVLAREGVIEDQALRARLSSMLDEPS